MSHVFSSHLAERSPILRSKHRKRHTDVNCEIIPKQCHSSQRFLCSLFPFSSFETTWSIQIGQIYLPDITAVLLHSLESGSIHDTEMRLHTRIQWVPAALSRGLNGYAMRLTTHIHSLPRLKTSGATSPVLHMTSWRAHTSTALHYLHSGNSAKHFNF